MTEHTDLQESYDKLLDFFKALGSVERLKIAGLLAQRSATVVELARTLGLRETHVARHLARLEEMGLVRAVSGESTAYVFSQDALLQLKKEVFSRERRTKRAPAGEQEWEQKLFDTFVVDGRLMGIPAQHKRRVAIAKWLATRFEYGVRYTEQEINERIQAVYHDYASLRRYMVDYGFMQRDHGVYWRALPEQGVAEQANLAGGA